MNKTEAIFRIDWSDSFTALYRCDLLHLGAIVFVSFDATGAVSRLDHHAFDGSIKHCVINYHPTIPSATLSTGPKLQEAARIGYAEQMSRWLSMEQFDAVIAKSNDRLRVEHLHTTAEQQKSLVNLLETVVRRLDLCEELKNLERKGLLWLESVPLRVYLSLTCFDRIGQETPYLNLHDWICKNEVELESKENDLSKVEFAKSLWKRHNELYGNRKSFHRFIYQVLDESHRKKLFDSIVWTEWPVGDIMGENVRNYDKDKLSILYQLRNNFTHRATYVEDSIQTGESGGFLAYVPIVHKTKIIRPRFLNWPDILEECVRYGVAKRFLMELDGDE